MALILASGFLVIRWIYLDINNPEPWTVLPQIVLMLIGVWGNKKASAANIELFKDFQRQLSNITDDLIHFNPLSAVRQLMSLKKSIDDSSISGKFAKKLNAEFFFTLGRCNSDIGKEDNEFFTNFITAYRYRKDDLKITERACTSLFYVGQIDESKKIAKQILLLNPFNPRAWAIKVVTENIEMENIPIQVRENTVFKHIVSVVYLKQKNESLVRKILNEELKGNFTVPITINYHNLPYWLLVCSLLFQKELIENPNDFLHRKNETSGKSDGIKKCRDISFEILNVIGESELFRTNGIYQRVFYFYHQSCYLIDNDRKSILQIYGHFKVHESSQNSIWILQFLIPGLSQIKEYEKVIELCEAAQSVEFRTTYILANTYYLMGDFQKCADYFRMLIQEVISIEDFNVGHVIIGIGILRTHGKADTKKIYHDTLSKKSFAQESFRRLVQVACIFDGTDSNQSEVLGLLDLPLEDFDPLPEGLKDFLCKTLSELREFEKSNAYLLRYINEGKSTPGLYYYVRNICLAKSNHKEALRILQVWRKNFDPQFEFIAHELNILIFLNDYAGIEELCSYGLANFSDNGDLFAHLLKALSNQKDKKERLLSLLIGDLSKYRFSWQHSFQIASICFKNELYELGAELIYKPTKESPDNATIRQTYFSMMTIDAKKFKREPIEVTDIGMTARITYDDTNRIVHIDESTILTNNIAKELIGRKKGDEIKIKESSFGKEIRVVVVDILDKYSGLLAEIIEEISNGYKLSGYSLKSISWKENDIEELHQKFVSEFGADGEYLKLRTEDAFDSYYLGKIPFSELVGKTNPDKIMEIYRVVTSNNSKGFIIPPISIFNQREMQAEAKEYVIDFSSLVILSKWEQVPYTRNFEFIVSQHLKDFLKDKLHEVNLMDDTPLTISILLTGVYPIAHPPDYKTVLLEEFTRMFTWVEKNCRVEFAPEKLDLLLKHPEFIEGRNWYFNYAIDTVYLSNAQGRSLISDDAIYYQSQFAHLAKPVTLEHFVNKMAPKERHQFQKWFLMNNYLGLTLTSDDIKRAFDESPILDSPNIFQKCLKNLPYSHHRNENVIFDVIEAASYIYSHSLDKNYRLRIIEGMFIEALRGYPLKPATVIALSQKVRETFRLLGVAELEVMQLLTSALSIVANAK